jgi:hypothetical protein
MNDAPQAAHTRATLVHAARRLAAAFHARAEGAGAETSVRALERAVVAYVVTYGGAWDRGDVATRVAARVRSALWTDDAAGHPEAVIALVVDIARRAADTALLD